MGIIRYVWAGIRYYVAIDAVLNRDTVDKVLYGNKHDTACGGR